ncbi:hypothetical protein Ahy_A01g002486 [Arachis hypogaea]|uniref:Replication factor A C-terminal domain-containing protein n=1 Tax=Arachis hypogaea TaxID=3818 RepID=A0A445ER28_ARAHY|nr:hypothetical protein Ahy_A01g002486 [Arachis hypogaea]
MILDFIISLDLNGLTVTCRLYRRGCWKGRGYGDDYMHGHMLDIKCPKIQLELYYAFHSRKHKIKCTLFGELVDQVLPPSSEMMGNLLLDCGKHCVFRDDWSYTSCKTCPKKVLESKDRYWCDHCRRVGFKKWEKGESYPKSLDTIVDKRFLFKLNIIYKNINAVEGVYNIIKISDDEYLMFIFGSTNSSFNASCSQHVPNTSTTETGDNSNGHEAVSLSKDSAVESNCDSSYETPAKRSSLDIGDGSKAKALVFLDVQASANKTFKRNCAKKKLD